MRTSTYTCRPDRRECKRAGRGHRQSGPCSLGGDPCAHICYNKQFISVNTYFYYKSRLFMISK